MGEETSALGLFTDLYELTMAQGYLLSGKGEEPALFPSLLCSVIFATPSTTCVLVS